MGVYRADYAEYAAELRRRVGFIAQIMQSVPQSFDDEWVFITQISGSMPQSRAEEWMCIAQSCAGGLTDLAKGVFEVGNVGC